MPRHDAERARRDLRRCREGNQWSAQAAVGDRRRVGDEAKDGGLERMKAETDHHGPADGDRGAAAGRSFQKGTERESDEDCLNTRIGGQAADRPANDIELAGLDGDVVQEHGVEDGPADRQQTEACPVDEAPASHADWHAADKDRDENCHECRRRPRLGSQPAPRNEKPEKHEHRKPGEDGRQNCRARDLASQRIEVLRKDGQWHRRESLSRQGRRTDSMSHGAGCKQEVRGNGPDIRHRLLDGIPNPLRKYCLRRR